MSPQRPFNQQTETASMIATKPKVHSISSQSQTHGTTTQRTWTTNSLPLNLNKKRSPSSLGGTHHSVKADEAGPRIELEPWIFERFVQQSQPPKAFQAFQEPPTAQGCSSEDTRIELLSSPKSCFPANLSPMTFQHHARPSPFRASLKRAPLA